LSVTGVVAALEFEARSLGDPGDGSLISVSGIGAANAARSARALVAAGAGALLSWGVAGALDPALACGAAVLPAEVLREPGELGGATLQRFETCRGWRERLLVALQGQARVVSGTLLTSAAMATTAARKASLFHQTMAVAVDMESAAVAEVAAEHGLPFIALRVILDTARDSLPGSVMRAFGAQAAAPRRRRPAWPLLWPLLITPAEWGPVLRLAARYRVARHALVDCSRLGRPTLAVDARGGG
jgi:adenosylhomocysteine nucleosidase